MAASTSSFGALLRGMKKMSKKTEKALTAKARKNISPKNFALPGGRYPIHDLAHAKNALARVAQNGTADEIKKVKAAVHKKYPSLKPQESLRIPRRAKFQESSRIRFKETADPQKLEGRIVDVVLVTEGLGNKRDMNYYGPEAMQSGVAVFEGAPAYLNHPTEEDAVNIPERRVEDKCGYFKNLRVESLQDPKTGTSVVGLCGELHLDQSDAGDLAFRKIETAVHYRSEFPTSSVEYVGLSVNADGEAEKRTVTIQGEEVDVNYVTAFAAGAHNSCDVVTSPARGGRFRSILVEDESGALRYVNREVSVKLLELIKSALAGIKAVESVKEPAEKAKKLAEAAKKLKEAEDAMDEADVLGMEALCKQDGESEGEHKERLGKLAKSLQAQMEAYEDESEGESKEAEDEDGEDDDGDAGSELHAKGKAAGKLLDGKKDMEAARAAVRHLIQESKLPQKFYEAEDVEDLAKLPFVVAKRQIAREARNNSRTIKIALEATRMPSTFVPKNDREEDGGDENLNASLVESFKGRK